MTRADLAALAACAERSAALAARKRSHGVIQAAWEDGTRPSTTHILRRGDWAAPLAAVEPGFPAALCSPGHADLQRPGDIVGPSTGRRLALARWLTSALNPLTARVIVNRIWQHHFGLGIVATPDNFGVKGARPDPSRAS